MFESAIKAVNNLTKQIQNPEKYWKEKIDRIYEEALANKTKSKFHTLLDKI